MSNTLVFFKSADMAKKFPLNPRHTERTCWGRDKYHSASAPQYGNGAGRTQHPDELLKEDWYQWGWWGIVAEDATAEAMED